MLTREAFARLVKDALTNFYDTIHLQTHPLVKLLGLARSPGQTVGEALRQLLRETVESLRPPNNVPLDRPEWLGYRLLWLHYVQSLSQPAVCQELGLSQATFYRRQQEAIEATVSVLWERYAQQAEKSGIAASGQPSTALEAMTKAIELASLGPRQPVPLRAVLESALQTFTPLPNGEA